MKRSLPAWVLLFLGLLLAPATAQCVAVGGINTVPQVGVTCASEPSIPTYAATSVALVPVAAGARLHKSSGDSYD